MRTRRCGISFVLIAIALALAYPVSASLETILTVSFQADQLSFERLYGYDYVRLTDGSLLSHLGEPSLPAKQIHIAIPSGHEALAVTVSSVQSEELPGAYRILPAQPPLPLNDSPRPSFVKPDEQIYRSHSSYPAVLGRLNRQTDLAGQQMAVVTVYPLQYVPATGRLILHRKLEIAVETRPGRVSPESYAQFTDQQRQISAQMIHKMVVNPQDVVLDPPPRAVSKALSPGQFDHVVITSSTFDYYFDDLVQWHNRRGLRDTVVTTDWINAHYSGDDTTRIRNFIIDAHSTWGTMYFLLGGEENVIPFCYRTYVTEPPYPETPPSDNYYADYDDDWTWEVMVGRISGQFGLEFTRAVDKILNYEKNPPLSDYILEVLFIGMDYDSVLVGEDMKEEIALDLPPRFNINKVYDSHTGNHLDSTIAYLDAGQNLVNHADHCNWWAMATGYYRHGWLMYSYHVDALTNDNQPSNVVACGCWPAAMPEEDCMAEHFLFHNPNAGVSFTGNTRVGYTNITQQAGSSGLERGWWKALFLQDLYTLGEMVAWSKHQHDQDAGAYSNYWKHCEWQFVLAGDPAMPIWTDTPQSLDVTHPGTLPGGSSSFAVHVASGGGDLDSAYVCLWKPGEVYLTGYTDAGGDVVFIPAPATPGSLFVTATKHNYLPYEGQAQVTDQAPPPVTDLAIALSRDDLVLNWSSSGEKTVVRYVVYRNIRGDFVPSPEDSIGGTADTIYTDIGVVGGMGTGHYYVIKSVSDSGGKSEPSNCVGELDIELRSE